MNRLQFSACLATFLGALTAVSAPGENSARLPEGAAVTVNGQAVPEAVVQAFVAGEQQTVGSADAAALRKTVIDQVIDRTLIEEECQKRGISPTDSEIRAEEERLIQSMPGEERFDDFLKEGHFTREQYREYVLKTAAASRALAADFAKKSVVTSAEIENFYKAHAKSFKVPERFTGADILFNCQPDFVRGQIKSSRHLPQETELGAATKTEIARKEKLAQEVEQKAKQTGADFAALARQYSDDAVTRDKGGVLGPFKKGARPTPLERALAQLQPGEVGPLLKVGSELHVIKLINRQPAGTQSLTDATEQIRRSLAQIKSKEMLEAWLADARAKATIVRSEH